MSGYRRLTAVSGVGERKADRLYAEGYENIVDLKHATQAELSDVDGIGNALAARIKADVGDADTLTLKEVVEECVEFTCPCCGDDIKPPEPMNLDHMGTIEVEHDDCGCTIYDGEADPYVDLGVARAPTAQAAGKGVQADGSGQQPLGDCPACGTTVTDAADDRIEEDGDVYCSVVCYNGVGVW